MRNDGASGEAGLRAQAQQSKTRPKPETRNPLRGLGAREEWQTEIELDALREFGYWHQLLKCAEECAELAKECCKRMQGIENNARLAEEVADVTIIAEQIVLAFRLDAEVDYWRGVKLERLRRLTEERRNPTPETNPPQGG